MSEENCAGTMRVGEFDCTGCDDCADLHHPRPPSLYDYDTEDEEEDEDA